MKKLAFWGSQRRDWSRDLAFVKKDIELAQRSFERTVEGGRGANARDSEHPTNTVDARTLALQLELVADHLGLKCGTEPIEDGKLALNIWTTDTAADCNIEINLEQVKVDTKSTANVDSLHSWNTQPVIVSDCTRTLMLKSDVVCSLFLFLHRSIVDPLYNFCIAL